MKLHDQWLKLKECLPDTTILMIRVGDFYETFSVDARRLSGITDNEIVMTKRGTVPMAGVPYHELHKTTTFLASKGITVAIAEPFGEELEKKIAAIYNAI